MRKTAALLLILALAFVLAACGGRSETAGDPSGSPSPGPDANETTAPLSDPFKTGDPSVSDRDTTAPDTGTDDPVAGSDGLEIREYDDESLMVVGPGEFSGEDLLIPSDAGGRPVVRIEEDAFCQTPILRLTVPGTVQWICEDAFENCDMLETLILSEGNLGIGEGAFAACRSLKSLTVPATVEHVGRSAFKECLSLQEVVVKGNAALGSYAFAECRSLQSVVFSGTAGIPYSVSSEAFSGDGALETVTFSEGLTEIGSFCFEGCPNLKTLYLPKSLAFVGPSAFAGTGLDKVYYAGSEEEWKAIAIGSGNDPLNGGEIVYNYAG